MRKTGLGMMIFGAVLGTALFFVRRSAWFFSEAAETLSEPAQFTEAAFWASIITFGVGVLVLILSLFKRSGELPEEEVSEEYPPEYAEEYPPESYQQQYQSVPLQDDGTYIEPWYEIENAASVFSEPEPYMPDEQPFGESLLDCQPQQHRFVDPWIPDPPFVGTDRPESTADETIRVPDISAQQADTDWACEICGCRNPRFSTLCAVCGSARGSTLR